MKPPVWDQVVYGPVHVKENMPVGAKVISVKARSVTIIVFTRFVITAFQTTFSLCFPYMCT